MLSTTFEFDEEFNLTGEGSLTGALKELEEETVAQCLRASIVSFRQVEESYLRAISNDGKIIGGERIDLLERIDDFLNLILLLYCLLFTDDREEVHISIKDEVKDFYVNFTIRVTHWASGGRLTDDMVRPVRQFRKIFTEKLAPEVSHFLSDYKAALKDRRIDEQEAVQLKNDVKRMIYICIYLRFQVQMCLVSE